MKDCLILTASPAGWVTPPKVLTVKGSNRVPAPKLRKGRSGEFSVWVHNRDSLRELIASVARSGEVATSVSLVIDHAAPPRVGWLGKSELPLSNFSGRWTDSGFEGECTVASEYPLAILLAGLLRACTPTPGGSIRTQSELGSGSTAAEWEFGGDTSTYSY